MTGVGEPSGLYNFRDLRTDRNDNFDDKEHKGTANFVALPEPEVLLKNTSQILANQLRVGGYHAPPKAHPIYQRLDTLPKRSAGTTVSAFIFEGGVIVAADHHRILCHGSVPNIVGLNSHMLATISGGSEYLLQELHQKCVLHELAKGRRTSVADASKWLADTLSSRREEDVSLGVLIAGWEETGPVLYHVDNEGKVQDCKEIRDCVGKVCKCAVIATGSAAGSAQSSVTLKARYGMSVDEAVFVGKHSVCAAAWALSRHILEDGGDVGAEYGDVVSGMFVITGSSLLFVSFLHAASLSDSCFIF
ncbi:OLC1v1013939C1 [Oldenlandia corymbosa var. corymbosa]|uniref:OLC1v1013939C1 n=1 Tax=Oldenlandia corymbosa var. corymbosa TaxID=529605 RepID=A0AAV1E2Y4_OLDCO|nr:OLC1v1013939C1 [Oldenlandia corymbosa var. corymbosa]